MGCSSPHIERNSPDVILISVDTLRPDHLGLHGYAAAQTPTIDALGRGSRVFSQATTPFPRTTPALASLFTGLRPEHHGSREVGEAMKSVPTLPSLLKARGYTTIGVNANRLAGKEQGFSEGFSHFHIPSSKNSGRRAGAVTDYALAAIKSRDEHAPLFLWVHYLDPHFPYSPPRDWKPQPEAPRCRKLMRDLRKNLFSRADSMSGRGGRSKAALEDCISLYDAEIAYTDAAIGRLLEGLRAAGRLRSAFTVFTSDHGEDLGGHGLFYEHGLNVYDGSLRVPLMFRGPGLVPGVDDGVARLEDVLPTLLNLLGKGPLPDPAFDGVDLTARLTGATPLPETADLLALAESGNPLVPNLFSYPVSGRVSETYCINEQQFSFCRKKGRGQGLYDNRLDPALSRDIGDAHPDVRDRLMGLAKTVLPKEVRQMMVRSSKFKLVATPTLDAGHRFSLYDVVADPREKRDITAEHPEVAARLGTVLKSWMAQMPEATDKPRSEELLERLKALGYTE